MPQIHRNVLRTAFAAMLCAAATIGTGMTTPSAASRGPLGGPTVPDRETRTLVSRAMTGRFVPLELRPEAAAVRLLDLDEQTLARAQAIVDARGVDVAMLLVDRIDAVREITDLVTAGDEEGARRRLGELWAEFEPETPRSPLLDRLADAVGPAHEQELRRLVDEYWYAWTTAEAGAAATPADRSRVERRLAFGLFEREVREGYEATLRRYREVLEGINTFVGPTDQQRERIRDIVIDHIKSTRLQPTPEQRRETMRAIYDSLDPDRRALLFDYVTRAVIPDQ